MDHGDDGKKHHQQGGERQGLFEGMPQLVFFHDAVKRREQHDHHQPDQADRRPVHGQAEHQQQRGQRLHDEPGRAARVAALVRALLKILQNETHVGGQRGAVAEFAAELQHRASQQTAGQNRHRYRGHDAHETQEVPFRHRGDQQILRFAHQRAHAAQRRADGAVHQQRTQKSAELFQIVAVPLVHRVIVAVIVLFVMRALAGSDLVVHGVETHADADQHGGYRQRVEEGGQKGGDETEQQRQ